VKTGACLGVLENTKKPLAAAGHRSSDCQGHEKKNALRNHQKTKVVIRGGERISVGNATSQLHSRLVAMSAPDYAALRCSLLILERLKKAQALAIQCFPNSERFQGFAQFLFFWEG
jgi:hypothetical protein